MKKIFTLISVALCAMTAQAQDVYDAVVNGKLAPEFAAVAGEDGGVATNAADGKSIITITKGKATVTAVGGTTPANDEEVGGAAQQIVPGAAVADKENTYEVAEVKAWNNIEWGKKNQGDIDFSYITGTGNPYVKMYCVQNSKDGDLVENSYKADYVYYEPDGSLGMPITGLYYKFSASAKGAFKVKVWANKGNRKTFVVNAKDMKAQKLYASGYINGVNDANGQKKLLTVEQVDSVHHVYIYGGYEAAVEAGEKSEEELATMKAEADALAVEREYVIGNGNQNFWGWLTFDVEPGEEYWVFQHSSQIGFGGFEYYEGGSAAELIGDIEAPYAYTTNFSTYEDEAGNRVPWKGEKIVGAGQFMTDESEEAPFGYFFQNAVGGTRQNYLLLPDDVLAHSAKTEALTIAVWVNADEAGASADYMWAPLFTAYAGEPQGGENTWPMMACQYRGVLQVNCAGWSDFTDEQNVKGTNALYHGNTDWLADKKWHYYTAVFDGENAKVYFDGVLKNEWDNTLVAERTQKGLFSNGADLKYICLGGNQAWNWSDNDPGFKFAKLLIKNSAMTQSEITQQMKEDYPNYDQQTGVENIQVLMPAVNAAAYNLAGQRVADTFKGIIVKNGKKFMNK